MLQSNLNSMMTLRDLLCLHHVLLMFTCSAITTAARLATISVDASQILGHWIPVNRFFGCDEPNFAYYPRGQELINKLGAISKSQTYFRTHNLLTTGNASLVGVPALKWGSTNAYTEDEDGKPVYNFTIVDRIFDAYLAGNVKPYVQVGFMPSALATNPEPYFFKFDPDSAYNVIYTGWSHTPENYQAWEELAYQWATHCLEKYGEDEVLSWYWEVWNEPNIACQCPYHICNYGHVLTYCKTGTALPRSSICCMTMRLRALKEPYHKPV